MLTYFGMVVKQCFSLYVITLGKDDVMARAFLKYDIVTNTVLVVDCVFAFFLKR